MSWTESNSSHEILPLAPCRTFVSVAMRKRLRLYFEHMIENDPQGFPMLEFKMEGDSIKDWQRWTKESNARARTVHD